MSEGKTPEGPDFGKGVAASDIAEGGMLAGHVGDEAVLVVRMDGVLHAIGAECTHYHGPLADGLIKDGVVRCPWHHACFSLKTGEAIGAPAFDPVACYKVDEKEGLVFVKDKLETRFETLKAPASVKKVVVVGGGAGGFAATEMLRRKGYLGDLVLLSADADAPYDRPNCSKDFLSGEAPADWMPLRDEAFYKDQKIDLRLNTEVENLDLEAKKLGIKGGEAVSYDILILATGGEPQRPPIPGLNGDNVFLLRSLRDAAALARAAETAKVAAVIGASFIGLEAAAALKKRGLEVHVVAPETVPFEKVLGVEVGRWAQSVHEEKGVVFHLGRKVHAYADGVLNLDEGRSIKVDIVVLGTGVKPRVALAEAAGLKVDNGVVVDDHLRAAEDVYAVGDIARYPDSISGQAIRVEHWVHAERQGQHVARAIMGEDKPYADVPFFWSAHYEAAFHYDGHAESFDPPKVDGSVRDYDATVRYEKDGILLAVVTLDRDMASLQAEVAFEHASEPEPEK
ncbi:FAD-dependent oxidoreductase [Caulobacter sp. S45]|uniref:FAD-dependent oxidoreductase n=1 Tax=Caulobacter sp. S45 TaxID=1641861 RepID=UPI00131E2423|nr:FAD-dependent oxidoreductase [Caulobacter sp. S45]